MSEITEQHQVLHPGHFGALPNRSSQEALIQLVTWIKSQWRAGRMVGAIFADVKSSFPSVHHPRMIHTSEAQGFPPQLINIIQSFLSKRETRLSFNGFESQSFKLTHGLPQGSPLSPLLYLLYNNSLLTIPDTRQHSTSLGFVDDVVLLTAAINQHELCTRMQSLADAQIDWAAHQGAIFDVQKTKWVMFSPSAPRKGGTVNFGDRRDLEPVQETKWLGVTLDATLTFKRHKDEVITTGKKRANFLSSLSNTRWGIPPKLFKILISSTVHAATDYAVAAWINLPIPKFFTEKLTSIDAICATRALGALKNSPHLFLRHDLDLKLPNIRLTAKIISTIAIIAAKPPSDPLYRAYTKARSTNPHAHKGPLNAFFTSPFADRFSKFLDIQQPDTTIPFPPTPNFSTLNLQDKARTIKSIQDLRMSNVHTLVYSDGSRIEGKNTAASAWCENNAHNYIHQLGKEREYGIFEAEFKGFVLALHLAKHSLQPTTQQITIIMDNQGVVKDMSTKKTTSRALTHKIEAIRALNDIEALTPNIKVTLQWCPGHKGIPGNKTADRLAKAAAKKDLPPDHQDKPTFASFRAAIKDWAEKESIADYTAQDIKRLGHQPHPRQHLAKLSGLKNKHSVAAITQLRTGHIPLYQYLANRNLQTDPTCKCNTGPENVEHFLFSCPTHEEHRAELRQQLEELDIPFNKTALSYPEAIEPIANYPSSTWRLKSRWDWAEIQKEAVPRNRRPTE